MLKSSWLFLCYYFDLKFTYCQILHRIHSKKEKLIIFITLKTPIPLCWKLSYNFSIYPFDVYLKGGWISFEAFLSLSLKPSPFGTISWLFSFFEFFKLFNWIKLFYIESFLFSVVGEAKMRKGSWALVSSMIWISITWFYWRINHLIIIIFQNNATLPSNINHTYRFHERTNSSFIILYHFFSLF